MGYVQKALDSVLNIKLYIVVTVMTVLLLSAVWWGKQTQRPQIADYLQHMGGDFTLESANGPLSLQDFKGDVVLVYFGYAHCPDVCPAALNVMAKAIHTVPEMERKHIRGLFVSLDPRRDSPQTLAEYTRFFDPAIRGVTGSADVLKNIASLWRVDYKVPDAAVDSHYAVEHSNFIYLVNPQGKIAGLFDERTSAKEIATSAAMWLN